MRAKPPKLGAGRHCGPAGRLGRGGNGRILMLTRSDTQMPRFRLTMALLLLGALTACSPDYSAIRDWSARAREIVLPSPDPGAPAPPAAPAPAEPDRRDALLALRDAAGAWLGALALFADDGFLRERDNPLLPLAARARPFDPEGAAAIADLGEAMAFAARRNWRAPQLAYAVDRGNASFQSLLAALERQRAALAAAPLALPEPAAPGRRPTPPARAPLDAWHAEREAERAREAARRDMAGQAAVARIAEGHALLHERRRHLSQAETARLIRAQESELNRLAPLVQRP
jgi:hypothetical protein